MMLTRVLAVASLLVLAVPSAMGSSADAFVDKIIAAESSGDPRARPLDPQTGKPLSSAFGAGQFIAATWLAMVRKYRPDLATKSDGRILEMRSGFALSREMTVRYAEENRAYLLNKDLKPTEAALYLAHFAGPRGTTKLLKAHRDTPVEDLLSRAAIAANGFLEGKTVAGLYAWAKAKMNVDVAPASSRLALASSEAVTTHNSTGKPATRAVKVSPAEVRFIRGAAVHVVVTE